LIINENYTSFPYNVNIYLISNAYALAQTIKDFNLAIIDFPIGNIAADVKKNISLLFCLHDNRGTAFTLFSSAFKISL